MTVTAAGYFLEEDGVRKKDKQSNMDSFILKETAAVFCVTEYKIRKS